MNDTKTTLIVTGLLSLMAVTALSAGKDSPVETDIVIYGGTPAGVMSAVAAARAGNSVALVDMNNRLGGVVSGGLTATDIGKRETVGGLANEFFERITEHYRKTYGPDSDQLRRCRNGITFEPSVAEKVFNDMVRESRKVTVWKKHRFQSVKKEGGAIASIMAEDLATGQAKEFRAKIFIDASYEGDLMAAAGVPNRVGREAREEYNESLAGIGKGPDKGKADHRLMSYNYRLCITTDPTNLILFPKPDHYDPTPWLAYGARINRDKLTQMGELFNSMQFKYLGPNLKKDLNWGDLAGANEGYVEGDWKVRDAIAKKYSDHGLSGLWYLQNDPEIREDFRKNARKWGLPKDEFTDTKNLPFQLYVREARRMVGAYVLNQNDLTQNRYKADGVCAGSYGVDCHAVQFLMIGNKRVADVTPHTLVYCYDVPYRSLIPKTEPTNLLVPVCLSLTHVANCSLRMEPVFMMLGQAAGTAAALAVAKHTSVQGVDPNQLRAQLRKQGAVLDFNFQPQFRIAWTPEKPKPGETVRFRIESGELRDPIRQIWWDFSGDGTVASQEKSPTHSFSVEKTHQVSLLVEDAAGRRRMVTASVPVGAAPTVDITVDDRDAELFGKWDGTFSRLDRKTKEPDVFLDAGIQELETYPHPRESAVARLKATVPRAGRYQVCLGFRPAKKFAKNLSVLIRHAGGESTVTVNQRENPAPFYWFSLGEFRFEPGKEAVVELLNKKADGVIALDGVRWIWIGE